MAKYNMMDNQRPDQFDRYFDEEDEIEVNEQKPGWIEVICGSMFSGKTEELIRRLKRSYLI